MKLNMWLREIQNRSNTNTRNINLHWVMLCWFDLWTTNRIKREDVMRDYSLQREEIETIKPRTITVNLSDADVRRLAEKSGEGGLMMVYK